LRQAIAGLVGSVAGTLGELGDAAEQCAELARVQTEAIGSLFGRLNEEMGPLEGAVEQVKTAASKVGIPWA
jgi:hypothetical protein